MRDKFFLTGLLIIFLAGITSCSGKEDLGPDTPDPGPPEDYPLKSVSKVFGFDNQDRYAYCPSVIIDGTETHVWFCGTEPAGQFIDHIYYLREDEAPSLRTIKTSLAPGQPGTWDDRHVCDPSVVKGTYLLDGVSYMYAMFYLGNRTGRYYNEIGVAFSNSLDEEGWKKYPVQLVSKTWTGESDLSFGSAKAWGVGQPSAFSVDGKGKVVLTYTIGDADGTRVVQRQADLSDMNNVQLSTPVTVSTNGMSRLDHSTSNIILLNADFAYDTRRSKVYMSAHVLPNPSTYPDFIPAAVDLYEIPYDAFLNGTGSWKLKQRLGSRETGHARNHNSAIGRNAYGEIPNLKRVNHYFTVSNATPDVSPEPGNFAEWTYGIYKCSDVNMEQ